MIFTRLFTCHLSEKPGETPVESPMCKHGCQGKLQKIERQIYLKCENQPTPLYPREWPWRELSAPSILFPSLWNTEITKYWLKMAVSFVLLLRAKRLWEVFTGGSSTNGCWVVLTFQKKKNPKKPSNKLPPGASQMACWLTQFKKKLGMQMCLRKLLPKSQHPLQTVVWLNTERNIKNLPAKAFAKVLNDKLMWILFLSSEKRSSLPLILIQVCLHV